MGGLSARWLLLCLPGGWKVPLPPVCLAGRRPRRRRRRGRRRRRRRRGRRFWRQTGGLADWLVCLGALQAA